MKELVESILQKEYTKANELFSEQINSVVSRKLTEAKKMYAAKMSIRESNYPDDPDGRIGEANVHKAIVQDLIHIADGGKNPKIVGKQVSAETAHKNLTKLANSEGDHRDTVNDITNIHGGGIHYPTKEDSADLVRIAQEWHKGSDKMSMKEQLKVDNKGKFHEPTGYVKNASIEKAERGLTEGDVVSIGGSIHKTKNYTVSVGKSDNDPVVVHHESSGTKTRITHPDARAYVARIADKRKLNDEDVDNLKSKYKPETMKEEAKKAALSIVAKRKQTSEEKVKRFLGALEGPGRLKTSEKPKLVN